MVGQSKFKRAFKYLQVALLVLAVGFALLVPFKRPTERAEADEMSRMLRDLRDQGARDEAADARLDEFLRRLEASRHQKQVPPVVPTPSPLLPEFTSWAALVGSLAATAGLAITNYFGYKREQREAAKERREAALANDAMLKLQLEVAKLRVDLEARPAMPAGASEPRKVVRRR